MASLRKTHKYWNFPNYLTFGRIALIPLMVLLLLLQAPVGDVRYSPLISYAAAIVFILGAISDLIDGHYARKMGIAGDFGKFLDPLADKLMVLTVMVLLIPLSEIPAWMVILFLVRELAITGLRSMAASEGVTIAADHWGKKKTACQNVALTCFLLPPSFIGMNSRPVAWFFLILALTLTLGSGINYFWKFFKDLKHKTQSSEL